MSHHRTMLLQLLPGVVLPGLVYFLIARHTSVEISLAAASSVPLLHIVFRLLRGKAPSVLSLGFVVVAGISITLSMRLHSPMFILAKGAVISGLLGLAFSLSAVIRRPLTRWLAVSLSCDHAEAKRRLSERWANPKALFVFRILSVGWGVLLLMIAGQQIAVVLTMSPGMVMTIEPAVQGVLTVAGIFTSILYVRRMQQMNPELDLLPARTR